MTRNEILEILKIQKSLYSKFIIDDDVINSWLAILNDYDSSIIKQCIYNYFSKYKYIPTLTDILKKIEDVFTAQVIEIKNTASIIVRFGDLNITFKCKDEMIKLELIEWLKSKPTRQQIINRYNDLLNEELKRKNDEYNTVIINQSLSQSFNLNDLLKIIGDLK